VNTNVISSFVIDMNPDDVDESRRLCESSLSQQIDLMLAVTSATPGFGEMRLGSPTFSQSNMRVLRAMVKHRPSSTRTRRTFCGYSSKV
jgi:hypothetical protein